MSMTADTDHEPRDDELRDRLDALARAGTAGLRLEHPRALGVATVPSVHRRRSGTARWAVATVAAAAVIALLGVAVWASSGDPGSTSVASDATATSATPATPAERLRAAVAATRAGAPFAIRSAMTDPSGYPVDALEPSLLGSLPTTEGTHSEWSATVWTYDGEGRVGVSWQGDAGETPIRLIHDTGARQVYWEQESGGWRRAPIPDGDPMAVSGDPLDMFGAAPCVSAAGDDALVVLHVPGPCPADPATAEYSLVLHLRPDGRIDRVERSGQAGADGLQSVAPSLFTFVYDEVAPLELPDPSTVTDSPTPMGFGWAFRLGADGGWALPMEPADGSSAATTTTAPGG